MEHNESQNLAQKMDKLHKKFKERQYVATDTKYLHNASDFVKYCTITNAIDRLRFVTTLATK